MSEITLAGLFQDVRQRIASAGLDHPAADARALISGLLGISQTTFLSDPDRVVTTAELDAVEAALSRRLKHEPVHRILGRREFYGMDFDLSPATLEPRADTEVLVERALPYLRQTVAEKGKAEIVDFGTGTGAIAISLLVECPQATCVGVDISMEALVTAQANADRLGVSHRFSTLLSNWGDELAGTYDLIVSNPPYIATAVVGTLTPEVRLYDPVAALDGGEDGLDAYRALARDVPRFLAPSGILAVEIGYDQREAVARLFLDSGFLLKEAVVDYGGNDRVLVFSAARVE